MFLNGGSGKDKLTGGAGADTIYGLGGDDSLSGLGGEDVLAGNDGNDTLSGGGADDYLMGGLGNDRIDGGTGFDWAGYEDATAAVRVDLALTTAQNTLGAGIDQLVSIEYVYGSSYGDTLMGTSGFNYIFGGDGHDSLSGRGGDDFLAGGSGKDMIDGGAGIDTVSFDDGVSERVAVNLATNFVSGHGDDSLVSIENVYGTAFDDNIGGDSGGNYLFGGAGNDVLWADGSGAAPPMLPAGEDVLDGGEGDDMFVPGQATEIVVEGGEGIDLIYYRFGGDGPQLNGVHVDLGYGGPQQIDATHVLTLSNVEQIYGTDHNDVISAGAAKNLMYGADGYDTFVFRSLAELGNGNDADTVWDDMLNGDKIDLSAIDADTTLAGNQAFHAFTIPPIGQTLPEQQFTGQAGEVIVGPPLYGIYLLQFDVNGDQVADASLWVNSVNLSSANFIL
ncbi:calcium-binding protein [Phenylobacterium sp.]|uniref:calcium-binding protein n=1 Tax=Phenylobacterium sp. TaxID=1871053 RepID=UPI0027265B78|nr:calcium-binding protein [Phenylobacterium sp.]MDO8799317.1 calcium-binding protein [Phenylobacterium sp.]